MIYALSHTRYKIMYVYQPTVPLKKEILLHFFTFDYVEKSKASGRGKAIKQN